MKKHELPCLPERLLPFFAGRARILPWRTARTPYAVLVSEIMLQQTRVDTVIPYFERFMKALPTVRDLADASETKLFSLWAGLGYYRRARNLQAAARMIVSEFGGEFPRSAEELRKLPGVGAYTAGAVASIAFNLPEPAVDGNVLRVLSRITASEWNALSASESLKKLYPAGRCGDFTESLMELGATVCMPNGAPRCETCPVSDWCRSRDGAWKDWPPPPVKKARKTEKLTVYILKFQDKIAFRRRPESGLLAGMPELPNEPGAVPPGKASKYGEIESVREGRHIFTHIEWHMLIYTIAVRAPLPEFQWEQPDKLPLPSAFRKFLR